jgi:putative ABC transport system permease protein
MLGLFRTVSYRYFLLRRSRAGLVVLSILLGVALLVATRMLIQSMLSASNENLNPFARAADLIIMNGETGVPGELVNDVEQAKVPGVAQVEPLVVQDCGLAEPNNGEHVRLVGIRINFEKSLHDIDQAKGIDIKVDRDSKLRIEPRMQRENAPPAKDLKELITEIGLQTWRGRTAVIVGKDLAAKLPQDTNAFRLALDGRVNNFWAAGTVTDARGKAAFMSGKTVIMPIEDASALFFPARYQLTADSFDALTRAGVPDEVLSKLKPLRGTVFATTIELRDKIATVLTDDESDRYRQTILDHADRGRENFVTRIHIMYEPGADQAQARRRIDEIVAGRANIVTPDENDASFRDVASSLEIAFTLVGYIALLVGLFLVYISLAVSVAERRQDIGMLRSLGATRLQIAGLFAGEAIFLGTLGSLLGIPLGWGLARVAIGPIQQVMSEMFLPIEGTDLVLSWESMLLAFGSGVGTALLAALVPALQAAQEEPADAVRKLPFRSRRALQILYVGSCAFLMLLGLSMLLARDHLPERIGRFGGIIVLMLGAMASTPLFTRTFSTLLRPLANRILSLQGRLAADNLARSPARTGLVIAVLAAGVALLVQTAGLKVGTEKALLGWIDDQIPADLFVTSYAPITQAGNALPMDEGQATEILKDPELRANIDHMVAFRMHIVNFKDKLILVVAFDAAEADKAMKSRDKPMAGSAMFPTLVSEPDTVIVSDNFASQYGINKGDTFDLLGSKGKPITFKVVGTINDYTWNRGAVFVDRKRFKEEFGVDYVDFFHVYVRPDGGRDEHARRVAQVQDRIAHRYGDKQIYVLTRPEFREGLRDLLARFFRISYAQLLVVALVVSLGVVSALLISVLQRRRELGLLRAVGASRTQVVFSVLAEALLMGFFGSLIGFGVGLLLHWLTLAVLMQEESGFVFPFVVPWTEAALVMFLAMLVATAAGLFPAIRAMRLNIAEAIAYE